MKKPNIISAIHLAIVFLLFILPLIFSSDFVYVTTFKTLVFYFITQILFFVWLYIAILNKEYRPKNKKILWIVIAFLFFYTLAGVLGINKEYSFWSSFSRGTGLITIYHVFALGLVLYSTVKDKKTWDMLFSSSVFSAVVLSLFTMFSYLNIGKLSSMFPENAGPTGNSSYTGSYLLITLFISIYLLINSKTKLWKVIFSSSSVLIFFSPVIINWSGIFKFFENPLYLIGISRAASVSIILGLVIYVFYLALNKWMKVQKIFLLTASSLIFIFILLITVKGNPVNDYLVKLDVGNRLAFWDVATKSISERPLLGWGQENFEQLISNNINIFLERSTAFNKKELNSNKVHNIYLGTAVSGGFISLLFYLLILFFVFYYLFKKKENAPLVIMLVVLVLNNAFLFDILLTYVMMAILIPFSVFSEDDNYTRLNNSLVFVAPTVILAGFCLWFLFYIPFKQQVMLRNSFREIETDYSEIISMYPWKTSSQIFLMTKFWDERDSIKGEGASILLNKMRNLRLAIEPYIEENKGDYRFMSAYYYLNFTELMLTNDFELLKGLAKYNKDLELASPGNPELKNLIGTVEVNLEKLEKYNKN